MKIKKVIIKNYRSIKEAEFDVNDYSVCIGQNNSGKTNFLRALKVFYEIDKDKFTDKTDFPKFLNNNDEESWIEIEYHLTDNEHSNLKEEYKLPHNTLKVRKYLKSKEKVKASQSNIYAYEHGMLSNNLFYGAKNISQAKVGNAIYIAELTSSDNELKLTGPSVLRKLISFFMTKVVKDSEVFKKLKNAFSEFNEKFKGLEKDNISLSSLNKDINDELYNWDINFDINVNSPDMNGIIKNLLSHKLTDKKLGQDIDIKNMGQGFQRYLIYTIIKLSSKFSDEKVPTKKEFSPDLYLVLFDEPEAFLHPQQQEILNLALRELSQIFSQQIIATTHSPIFISKNIEDIPSFIRFARDKNGITQTYQIKDKILESVFIKNDALIQELTIQSKNPNLSTDIKNYITKNYLQEASEEVRLKQESIRYMLCLDAERCATFFADHVIICEGASEKIFLDYLFRNRWKEFINQKVYILDVFGKYNIHKFMTLFGYLGISHSVVFDKDNIGNQQKIEVHNIINIFIKTKKNDYTKTIELFDQDFEHYLGINKPIRNDHKPLNILFQYSENKIDIAKLNNLKEKIIRLICPVCEKTNVEVKIIETEDFNYECQNNSCNELTCRYNPSNKNGTADTSFIRV